MSAQSEQGTAKQEVYPPIEQKPSFLLFNQNQLSPGLRKTKLKSQLQKESQINPTADQNDNQNSINIALKNLKQAHILREQLSVKNIQNITENANFSDDQFNLNSSLQQNRRKSKSRASVRSEIQRPIQNEISECLIKNQENLVVKFVELNNVSRRDSSSFNSIKIKAHLNENQDVAQDTKLHAQLLGADKISGVSKEKNSFETGSGLVEQQQTPSQDRDQLFLNIKGLINQELDQRRISSSSLSSKL